MDFGTIFTIFRRLLQRIVVLPSCCLSRVKNTYRILSSPKPLPVCHMRLLELQQAQRFWAALFLTTQKTPDAPQISWTFQPVKRRTTKRVSAALACPSGGVLCERLLMDYNWALITLLQVITNLKELRLIHGLTESKEGFRPEAQMIFRHTNQ